jgi:hypothetical protein
MFEWLSVDPTMFIIAGVVVGGVAIYFLALKRGV